MLFFVSVGMLFDPAILAENTWPILATLFIIVVGKSVAAFVIVLAFRYPIATALMISASLAQIGEFSFILAELGVGLGLLPEQGRDLILAGAILSIIINPLIFAGIERLKPWLDSRAAAMAEATSAVAANPTAEPSETLGGLPAKTSLRDHTILVGYGRVGSLVGKALEQADLPFLVIEDADKPLAVLRSEGIETISGNGANADVFAAANVAAARRLIVAIPNAFEAGQVIQRAKAANPAVAVIARAHSDAEVEHLTGLGADTVIMGEREIARGIIEIVVSASQISAPGSQN